MNAKHLIRIPGTTYDITLRFRGVVEQKTYGDVPDGGAMAAGTNASFFVAGGTPAGDGWNVYTLSIAGPSGAAPTTAHLNSGASGLTTCWPIDYTVTLPMAAGSTVTLTADTCEHRGTRAHFESPQLPSILIHVIHVDMNPARPRAYSMDLRAARAEATRARILDGAAALCRERLPEAVTLESVAERAGTTVRTVLRAFGSKEGLLVAALNVDAAVSHGGSPTSGDLDAAVRVLYDDYERIGDVVVQRLADESRLPSLKVHLDRGRSMHRKWVQEVFAPLVKRRSGRARKRLFDALCVATDVYVWKLARRDMRLSRPEAEALVRRMITALSRED